MTSGPVGAGTYSLTITNDFGCSQVLTYVVLLVSESGLVCDDLVHVSLDMDCNVVIQPTDVLEGAYPDYYDAFFGVHIVEHAPGAGNTTVNMMDIGDTLTAQVYNICFPENNCWGYLLIEDKIAPEILCCDELIGAECPTISCEDRADRKSVV